VKDQTGAVRRAGLIGAEIVVTVGAASGLVALLEGVASATSLTVTTCSRSS
jgi:hypothetical protein